MISYLGIEFSHQSIGNHNRAKLLDLIRLAPRSPSPQVQDFRDAVARENVMAAFDALLEAYFREHWRIPTKAMLLSEDPRRIGSRSLSERVTAGASLAKIEWKNKKAANAVRRCGLL
jgi:hypothetical protein